MTQHNDSSKCTCFDDVLEKVKEQYGGKIPEGSEDVAIQWRDRVFMIGGSSDAPPVSLKVDICFRPPKKAGGHAKNMTRDYVNVMLNNCPFCGRQYEK